jgi:hypothetical protein
MTHKWQSLWNETIKQSSHNHRRKDLTEKDRINLVAEAAYKIFRFVSYPKNKSEEEQSLVELNRLTRFVTKDSIVLDIGAGTGRVALSLAKHVKRITILEPARISMKLTQESAELECISNLEFVEELWSDFHPQETYDLVYSTWSQAVKDPVALMKMHEASQGYCALEMVASPYQDWDFYGQIFPRVMGEDFRPTGNYLNILTTLYEHGIYANLESWKFDKEIAYRNMEEAIDYWEAELATYAEVTEAMREKLRQFYQSRMNSDGSYTFNLNGGVSCMIWWHV